MDMRNTGDGANLRAHVQSSVDEKDELYMTKDEVVLTLGRTFPSGNRSTVIQTEAKNACELSMDPPGS